MEAASIESNSDTEATNNSKDKRVKRSRSREKVANDLKNDKSSPERNKKHHLPEQ